MAKNNGTMGAQNGNKAPSTKLDSWDDEKAEAIQSTVLSFGGDTPTATYLKVVYLGFRTFEREGKTSKIHRGDDGKGTEVEWFGAADMDAKLTKIRPGQAVSVAATGETKKTGKGQPMAIYAVKPGPMLGSPLLDRAAARSSDSDWDPNDLPAS